MTAKQLEQETGCKIMVRGKGSMRDKKKVSLFVPTDHRSNVFLQVYETEGIVTEALSIIFKVRPSIRKGFDSTSPQVELLKNKSTGFPRRDKRFVDETRSP